jgi:hypothetical protein
MYLASVLCHRMLCHSLIRLELLSAFFTTKEYGIFSAYSVNFTLCSSVVNLLIKEQNIQKSRHGGNKSFIAVIAYWLIKNFIIQA